jgi:hypothetical protein
MHCEGISLLERWNRRMFLQGALASAGGLVLGCGGSGGGDGSDAPEPTPQCPNAFAGGQQIDELAYANEDPVAFGTPIGNGLDGRLFFDLSQLAPDALITPNELFYVRTRVRLTRRTRHGRSDLTPGGRRRQGRSRSRFVSMTRASRRSDSTAAGTTEW